MRAKVSNAQVEPSRLSIHNRVPINVARVLLNTGYVYFSIFLYFWRKGGAKKSSVDTLSVLVVFFNFSCYACFDIKALFAEESP